MRAVLKKIQCLTRVSGVLMFSSAAAGQPIRALAIGGLPAPGTNGLFTDLHEIPTINELGRVAISATYFSGQTKTGMWTFDLRGSQELAMYALTPSPVSGGLPGDTWWAGWTPRFDHSGRLIQIGKATHSSGQNALTVGGPGSFQTLARTRMALPGTTGVVRDNWLIHPVSNAAGRVAFSAYASNQGVWCHDPGGVVAPVLVEGQPAPGLPGMVLSSVVFPIVNAAGGMSMVSSIAASHLDTVHYGTPGNMHTAIKSGDVVSGHVFDRAINWVKYNSNGMMAMWADMSVPQQHDAIVAGKPGNFQVVAMRGQSGPGMTAQETWGTGTTTTTFKDPLLNRRGDLYFEGAFHGSSNVDQGIWTRPAGGGGTVARGPHRQCFSWAGFGRDLGRIGWLDRKQCRRSRVYRSPCRFRSELEQQSRSLSLER